MKRLTIYDIKYKTLEKSPHFFDRQTLKFFGQTMKDFRIYKQSDGRYLLTAPIMDRFTGKIAGATQRLFNPVTNDLERL